MDLKTYIRSLPDEAARIAFAEECGTTAGHLRNVMGKHASCSPALAMAIEEQSDSAVMRWDMRDDWWLIWRELRDATGAPKPSQRTAAMEA